VCLCSEVVLPRHLVRGAERDGSTLHITGDLNTTTTLRVLAPTAFDAITWNGQKLSPTVNEWGAWEAVLQGVPGDVLQLKPPVLSDWRYIDSLPEIKASFDDSSWTVANRTSTGGVPSATLPRFGD
jgi:hypothetical protein